MNSCSTNFTIRLVGSRIVYIPSNASSAPTIPTSAPRYAAMKTWRNSKTIAGGTEMSASRTKFYLDKQNAKWSGVCAGIRSEEHTSELQSLMRITYAVFCLNKKKTKITQIP